MAAAPLPPWLSPPPVHSQWEATSFSLALANAKQRHPLQSWQRISFTLLVTDSTILRNGLISFPRLPKDFFGKTEEAERVSSKDSKHGILLGDYDEEEEEEEEIIEKIKDNDCKSPSLAAVQNTALTDPPQKAEAAPVLASGNVTLKNAFGRHISQVARIIFILENTYCSPF